jgi:uncharacterized protein (DUF885 family)
MTTSSTNPSAQVSSVGDEYWRAYLDADPFTASSLGVPGLASEVPDPSRQASDRFAQILDGLERRLAALDMTSADRDARLNWSFLHTRIHNQRVRIASDVDAVSISGSIGGLLSQLISDISPTRIDTAAAGTAFLERLCKLDGYIAGVGTRHVQANLEGRRPTVLGVQQAIDQLDMYLSSSLSDDAFLKPVREDHPSAQAIRDYAEQAVTGHVRPALAAYRDMLQNQLLNSGRDDSHVGLCHIPGGEDAYNTLIRHFTTTDMPAEAIHHEGIQLIASLTEEVRAVGHLSLGTNSAAATIQRLRDDPSLRFTSAQHQLEYVDLAYQRAVASIGGWFRDYRLATCDIQQMNLVQARNGITGYYTTPAHDGTRPGTFWVNTFESHNRPIAPFESITFHESVPGHHLQLSVGRNDNLAIYRQHLSSIAHREGWGLYVERLADEMNLYSSPVARLGMLTSSMLRSARLVVDTGMHHLGWPRSRAIAYLIENTALSAAEVENEIDRYIAVPGQALSYMIGQTCIERLRRTAAARLGSAFSLPEFHHCVLRDGTLPLATLSQVVEDWIEAGIRQAPAQALAGSYARQENFPEIG